jgi:hypothetical protein
MGQTASEYKDNRNLLISYRRDDSAGHTGRLYDQLSTHFGEDQLFMDIDTIKPGEDFVNVIKGTVSSCKILLAVIGKQWASITNGSTLRLDDPEDFVRLEIATAINREIRVIPVLVNGANMPRPEELPEDLRQLARLNAFEISDLRWKYDVEQLINSIEKTLPNRAALKQLKTQKSLDSTLIRRKPESSLWTFLNYLRPRSYRRRLELSVSGKVAVKKESQFLIATAQVNNVGLTTVPIEQRGSALRVSMYDWEEGIKVAATAKQKRLATFYVFENYTWIAPGEFIKEHQVIAIPSEDHVALRLSLRIVSQGIAWTTESVVE